MSDQHIIASRKNDGVYIRVMQGHFVSSSCHLNHYVGTSDIKHNHNMSVKAAKIMADYYITNGIKIDTVVCLYETQALGAYLAHELATPSMFSPNPECNIYVVGSEYDSTGNMIFRDNLKRMIAGKRVLLLISCITSGKTVDKAIESVGYYGGKVVGISSAFSAVDQVAGIPVNTIFTKDDVPGYESYDSHDCPLCQANMPVDAVSNGYGYSKL